MLDSETLEKLQNASVADRIDIIEMILRSLKTDVSHSPQPDSAVHRQRPAFGFMKNTGEILGDVVTPILPETAWDVLQ
jgi:hypothetical protein